MIRAGLRTDSVELMEMAVGEVLSNVRRHAYSGESGPVTVAVSRYPHSVSVLVKDGGNATVAPEVPRRLPPRTHISGRGLYLVGRIADDVRIHVNRNGNGLTVRLAKRTDP
jgi:anti-sigma regulatory factor (Ser/Thr protein kinase)